MNAVVVHLPRADATDTILRNVHNMRVELGDAAVIEVVTHGEGTDVVLAGSAHTQQVLELLAAGVVFDACQNSLTSRDLGAEHLLAGVQVVPSGIAHLARRQWEGFAYVRP